MSVAKLVEEKVGVSTVAISSKLKTSLPTSATGVFSSWITIEESSIVSTESVNSTVSTSF